MIIPAIESRPFSDLLSNIVDNRGKTCPTYSSGIALIATNCIKNDHLYPVYESVRHVSDETYRNWFRGHPAPGDFIFVTKGTPGCVCLVPPIVDFCIAQDMVAIRADPKKVDPAYLFAALRSVAMQGEIENLHVGSLIPHFKKGDFDKLLIPLPKKDLQEYIGQQYLAFSVKIDLLHRQNKTLEEIAGALWRKTFVEESNPNWKRAKLGDICTKITKGTTPTTLKRSFIDTGINFIKVESIDDDGLFIPDKFAHIDAQTNTLLSRSIIQENDILYTIAGTIGRTSVVVKEILPANTNQAVAIIRLNDTDLFLSYVRVLLKTGNITNDFNSKIVHAVQPNLSLGMIAETEILIPDEKSLSEFNHQCDLIFIKIKQNNLQIRTISRLRDKLLPKLMSGEVRVKL